jgi:hypothetical protein
MPTTYATAEPETVTPEPHPILLPVCEQICPMTGTDSCAGADAKNCTAC